MATPTSSTGDDLIIISDDTTDVGTATLPSNTVESSSPEITISETSAPSAPVTSTNASNDIFGGLDLSSLSGTEAPKTEEMTSPALDVQVATNGGEASLITNTPLEVTLSSEILAPATVVVEQTEVKTDTIEEMPVEQVEEEVSQVAETTISTGDDMDSILSDTIVKLQNRQELNRSTKGSKVSQIDGLNQKIATLKEQVENLKHDVGVLDAEFAKIDANVVALENMKSIPSEVAEIDMKSHNQSRVMRTKKAA